MMIASSWWLWLSAGGAAGMLLWQWRRARSDRWRQFAWLVAVLSACLLLSPNGLLRWPQTLAPLAILTPGNDATRAQAEAWAARQGATLMELPALPSQSELDALQQYSDAEWQMFGYGLLPVAWSQLPPRTVYWQAPESPLWRLRYNNTLRTGDSVRFALDAPATAAQIELRDSRNEAVLVLPVSTGHAEWSWRPATVGRYDWRVVVTGADAAVLKTIPIAVSVQPSPTQFVRGHFAAPSFEQRALRQWFEQVGFRGEFVSAMGPSLQRRDRFGDLAGNEPSRAAYVLVSLRSWQQANERQRRQWLNDAAGGSALVLLADGSENDAVLRTQLSRELAIVWQERSEAEQILSLPELALQRSRWHPQGTGNWLPQQAFTDVQVRKWQQGQVIWIGVLDSHRWWARQPLAYAEWWQQALQGQQEGVASLQSPAIGAMGRLSALCIDNAEITMTTLTLQAPDGRVQQLPLQADSWPGRACAYLAPDQDGWYEVQAPVTGVWRVLPTPALSEDDAWAAMDASARYTVAPAPLQERTAWQALPRWPFFLIWLTALTVIWWRERRQRGGHVSTAQT